MSYRQIQFNTEAPSLINWEKCIDWVTNWPKLSHMFIMSSCCSHNVVVHINAFHLKDGVHLHSFQFEILVNFVIFLYTYVVIVPGVIAQ